MAVGICMPLPGEVGWMVRGAVVWTCFATLVVKKWCGETTKERTWQTWALDASKQLIGGGWVTLMGAGSIDCDDYVARVLAETTIGLPIKFMLLVLLTRLFERGSDSQGLLQTGVYTDNHGNRISGSFAMQLTIWLAVVTGYFCVAPIVMPPFGAIASPFLLLFEWSPRVLIVVVTVLIPCAMYSLQVWVSDDFLKKAGGTPGFAWQLVSAYLPQSCVDLAEKLFDDSSPSEEDNRDYVPPKSAPRSAANSNAQSEGSYRVQPVNSVKSTCSEKRVNFAPGPSEHIEVKVDSGRGVGDLEDGMHDHPPAASAASAGAQPIKEEAQPTKEEAQPIKEEETKERSRTASAASAGGASSSKGPPPEAASEALTQVLDTPNNEGMDPTKLREVLAAREAHLKALKEDLERVLAAEEATTRQLSEHVNQQSDDPGMAGVDPSSIRLTSKPAREGDIEDNGKA